MGKSTKRSVAIAAAAVVTVGAAGAAYAAGWLINGSGAATASTSAIKPMHADISITGNVYPGKKADAVVLVDNPNDFPVILTGLTPGSFTVTKKVGPGSPNPTCAAKLSEDSLKVNLAGGPFQVEGKTENKEFIIPVTVSDTLDASCSGSAIAMSFTFTGTSTV
jgi:hypothetical protein